MIFTEVAIERKEAQESSESEDPVMDGMSFWILLPSIWLTLFADLEQRLNEFCNDLDEQRTPLDEWFHVSLLDFQEKKRYFEI